MLDRLKEMGFGHLENFKKDYHMLIWVWDLMKKKGYGISSGVRHRVAVKFEKEGLGGDLEDCEGFSLQGKATSDL